MADELRAGTYRPGSVRRFEIPKSSNPAKTRPIAILNLTDRVVHTAFICRIEGMSSKEWFAAFGSVFPSGWRFPGRVKRPPTDPVNALMSSGYTILLRRVEAACAAFGLDLALGALHAYHPGRPSLACDLMEPFRVPIIDRLVLSVLTRKIFSLEDFHKPSDDGSVQLTDEAWKRWLSAIESTLHAALSDTLSFQVQIVDRVRRFVESLPAEGCSFFQEETGDACELLEDGVDDEA